MFSVGEDVEADALFRRGGPARPSPVTWVGTARRAEVRILLRFTNAGASRRGEDDKGAREPLGQVELVGPYSNKSRMTQEFRDLGERLGGTKVNIQVVRKPRSPRRKQTRLDGDHLAEFEIDYQSGLPVNDLASKYGIARNTVFVHARRLGLPRRNPEVSPEQVAETAGLYRSGLSLADVGALIGVNASTVMWRLRKGGMEIRSKSGSPSRPPFDPFRPE